MRASKTPTSIPPPHGAIPPNFRPFLTPPAGATTPPFPMWPLPGLFPGAHNLFGRHEERKELSPGPAAARDRSKMSSGSSSDKEIPLPPLIPRDSCGDSADRDSAQNSSFDKSEADYNEKVKLGDIAGYVPAQRLEWKCVFDLDLFVVHPCKVLSPLHQHVRQVRQLLGFVFGRTSAKAAVLQWQARPA